MAGTAAILNWIVCNAHTDPRHASQICHCTIKLVNELHHNWPVCHEDSVYPSTYMNLNAIASYDPT